MRGHQVRHKILLPADLPVDGFVFLHKSLIDMIPGLSHLLKHGVRHMLRRDFQLPAHMIPAQFPEKGIILVCHTIIEPDTGTDEHLLHSRKTPQTAKQ